MTGYDCALIPGALNAATTSKLGEDNICGRSVGLVTVNGATAATVCSEYSRQKADDHADSHRVTMMV